MVVAWHDNATAMVTWDTYELWIPFSFYNYASPKQN